MDRGQLINSLNQALAFSPLYANSSHDERVFWPGCSAMKLDSVLIQRTYEALKEEIPDLGFSSWCCGKPTLAAGTAQQKITLERRLTRYFKDSGVREIYTLCPNCVKTLSIRSDVNVHSAWPLLARYTTRHPGTTISIPHPIVLHDPCASSHDEFSQVAAREILARRGIEVVEFDDSRKQTRCCGRINMIFLTNPAKSKEMLEQRLSATLNLPIVTYCESCVESFRGAGHPSFHLLEVIFDYPARRGIMHRLHTAHRRFHHA